MREAASCVAAFLLLRLCTVGAEVELNELLARNQGAVLNSQQQSADWIELYNAQTTEVDLSGMILTVEGARSNSWTFPVGAQISGQGYRVIWCDGSRSSSASDEIELNCGMSLAGESGAVRLYSAVGGLIDSIDYGFQLVNQSIGRVNGQWGLLDAPTPGTANTGLAVLGTPSRVRINEWMAYPDAGPDWFELFNAGPLPVNLAGSYLNTTLGTAGTPGFQIAPLSYLGAGRCVQLLADKKTADGHNHVSFALNKLGTSLFFLDPGKTVMDQIDFGPQVMGVSQGRLPDGANPIVSFPLTSTPGSNNYLPLTNVWINEVLAHTDPPLEDAIELYNPTPEPIDLGGWFLSNNPDQLKKYAVPNGTSIPAYGYVVFYEYQFKGTINFTLNAAHGDSVILSGGDAQGSLTGLRTQVAFGATANGVSLGRYTTSQGVDFTALSHPTFGFDDPLIVQQFRLGQGESNAYPLVSPIVINEIMYHPPDTGGTNSLDNVVGEYIELINNTTRAVPLFDPLATSNTWRIQGEVQFTFPPDQVVPALGSLLLVSFDPVADPPALAEFRRQYPDLPNTVTLFGPHTGKLSNAGGVLELYQPDPPQAPPHPDAGFVPYIRVDQVMFADGPPWPGAADGQGSSLQRHSPNAYGNDPVNWFAGVPTPGRGNSAQPLDTDQDGMPDAWEIQFGLNPNDPADAAEDPDHDGLTNLQEYRAGTSPRDAASALRIESVVRSGNGLVLRFQAIAGRSYSIWYRSGGAAGEWLKLQDLAAQPTTGMIEARAETLGNVAERFYRLVTP